MSDVQRVSKREKTQTGSQSAHTAAPAASTTAASDRVRRGTNGSSNSHAPSADHIDPALIGGNAPSSNLPNLGSSLGATSNSSASVKVDSWQRGAKNNGDKNSSLEGILRNQGYSLQDIYNKGKDGKTLLQRTAADNHLKNPNQLQDGQQVKVARKPGTVSTEGLKPGESVSSQAVSGDKSIQQTATRTETDKQLATHTNDAKGTGLDSVTEVPSDGKIISSTQATPHSVSANQTATNGAGDAKTAQQIKVDSTGTTATVQDVDKHPNMDVSVTPNGMTALNPGAKQGDYVLNQISPNRPKGGVERAGEWLDGALGNTKADPNLSVHGAEGATWHQSPDGSVQAKVHDNQGQDHSWNRSADSFFQRTGRKVDDFFRWMGL